MPYHFTKSCPICEHKEFTEFLTCTDFFTTSETFDIKRCNQCSFLFTQNFPSEAIIGKYYEVPEYVSHSDTKKGIVNYLYHLARRYMLTRKANLVESISGSTNGDILDYGCGTGYFLQTMGNRGWKITGIEKSDSARAFAGKEFNLSINEPDFLTIIPDESCDVITLWHVLEHIENLEFLLMQLKRIMKPNGSIIFALPNSDSYDAKYYGEYWAAFDVPRHLWHFSPKTIQLLGEKHQLKLVKQKGMPLDAFYISMLSEKNKGAKFAFLKGMLVGLAAFVASLRDPNNHSSMIYILKK